MSAEGPKDNSNNVYQATRIAIGLLNMPGMMREGLLRKVADQKSVDKIYNELNQGYLSREYQTPAHIIAVLQALKKVFADNQFLADGTLAEHLTNMASISKELDLPDVLAERLKGQINELINNRHYREKYVGGAAIHNLLHIAQTIANNTDVTKMDANAVASMVAPGLAHFLGMTKSSDPIATQSVNSQLQEVIRDMLDNNTFKENVQKTKLNELKAEKDAILDTVRKGSMAPGIAEGHLRRYKDLERTEGDVTKSKDMPPRSSKPKRR